MSTTGAQYDHWKQDTSKELQAFLKTAWKEPTPELRACYFAAKKKVVMQLLVFSLKPIQLRRNHKDWWVRRRGSTYRVRITKDFRSRIPRPMLMHIFFICSWLRKQIPSTFWPALMLAMLKAELSEDVVILTQPAPEVIQFGLVKLGTLYQCTKACYGLREAPKLWEEGRDKTLSSFVLQIDSDEYSLRQNKYHPTTCTESACQASTTSTRTRFFRAHSSSSSCWRFALGIFENTSSEARARVCIRHVAQNLRWTLHFVLFYETVQDL